MHILKSIVSLSAAFSLLTTAVFAVDIPYAQKENNPNLVLKETTGVAIKDGYAVLEAEAMQLNAKVVKLYEDEEASGGQAVQTTVSTMVKDASVITESAFHQKIQISDSGIYNIWGRIQSATTSSDTIFCSINQESYDLIQLDAQSGYYWIKLGVSLIDKGIYTISFKQREAGVVVDKILITDNSAFKPVGMNDVPVAGTFEDLYAAPPIVPKAAHPRLYLNSEYVEVIKENVKSPELSPAYQKMKGYAQEQIDIKLADKLNNHSQTLEEKIQARALMYVLGEADASHAKQTIAYARDYLSQVRFNVNTSDITRAMGRAMITGAVVYDWCYDCLEESDKEFFITRFKYLAGQKEIGYPPVEMSSVTSHAGESEIMRDLLSAGIAIYDEDPEMYNYAAGRFFEEFIDSREMFNKAGAHPEGSSYGEYRYQWEMYAVEIFSRMGYEEIFRESSEKVALQWIYKRRPDGLKLKDGDEPTYSRNTYFTYAREVPAAFLFPGSYYKNPYIKGEWLRQYALSNYSNEDFWAILFDDPSVDAKLPDSLPLAIKTTYPLSSVTARTSWQSGLESPAVIANMKAYEAAAGNHMHYDAGSFQIYYKGYLAIDSGNYHGKNGGWGSKHYWNYQMRSVAHNVMTVYDPNETFALNGVTYSNDGGQLARDIVMNFEELEENGLGYAKNEGIYIGPNTQTPEFSYIKSDLTGSYSNKVSGYQRAMVFMDLFDEDYPAAFVVFDKMDTSDASYAEKWLLHSIEEPVVNEDTVTIVRTEHGYNGKLVNKTLLPEKKNIVTEVIGGEGKTAFAGGVDYPNPDDEGKQSEQGSWRVEISTKKQSKNDLYLNAMYVCDNDKNLPELTMKKLEDSNFVGVSVKDRQLMFAKSGKAVENGFRIRVSDNGYDSVGCLVTDVSAGVWNITGGKLNINVAVKPDENALYFRAAPGRYTVKPMDSDVTISEITYPEVAKSKTGDFMIYRDNRFLYHDKETKLIDGVAYVPVKSLFTQLGAEVSWNSSDAAVLVATSGKTVAFTQNATQYTLNGDKNQLKHPFLIIDGTAYLSCKDSEKLFNLNFDYDEPSKTLFISEVIWDEDYYGENAVIPVKITNSANDGNVATNANDFDLSTRWSSEGDGQWLMYDMGSVMRISSVDIAFYNGDKRSTSFEIEVSLDGKKFTSVVAAESSGKTLGMESFAIDTDTRYIRFKGHGNNINQWNSVAEMQIIR